MSFHAKSTSSVHLPGIKSNGLPPAANSKPPHVLIAGGGIGGLMLANILERTNITYEIFEKAREIKPLGSVMCINPTVMAAFEQLGLYEDFLKISNPISNSHIRNADAKIESSFNIGDSKELVGYEYLVVGRSKLYELLLSRVPVEKIKPRKRVISFVQNKEGVMTRFQDGTTTHGDILVGADGTYSAVRQHLFKELSKMGKLPKPDSKPLSKGFICMVGHTSPLDPEVYPIFKWNRGVCDTMISNNSPWSWITLNLPGNVMAWSATKQLDSETFADMNLRNSEWGSEANEALIKEVSDFKTPYGTLGSLIDATPRSSIAVVFLEDKFFETWTHSRTVLIGDACHKQLPSAGLGSVNAMQDAIVLANCIYEMKANSYGEVVAALNGYRDQQYDLTKKQCDAMNCLSPSAWTQGIAKTMIYRPQIAFLPLIPNRGTADVKPQKPSAKYLEEQANVSDYAVAL